MKRKYWILSLVSTTILVLDQLTKVWVAENFQLRESLPVFEGFFNLTYVRNTGAAFGILADAPDSFREPFLLIVPGIALMVILSIFRKIPNQSMMVAGALSMVIGGAIGNLIDRVRLGSVIDFLDFHWMGRVHFPAFNIADIAICVGVGLLMIDLFREEESALYQ